MINKKYEKVSSVYYALDKKPTGLEFREVLSARPITLPGYEDFDFFVHKYGGHYVTTEAVTGEYITKPRHEAITQEAAQTTAVLELRRWLMKRADMYEDLFNLGAFDARIKALAAHIDKEVMTNGLSPRYKKKEGVWETA